MTKVKIVQSAWTRGQISEKMNARSDVQNMLTSSASVLENFVIMQQGGITKRPGTLYVGTVDNGARLIPFKNSQGNFIILATNTQLTMQNIDTGKVTSFSFPLTYTNIYEVKYAQNDNQMIFTHSDFPVISMIMTATALSIGEFIPSIAPCYDYNFINYDSLWFVLRNITNPNQNFKVGDTLRIGIYISQAHAAADTGTTAGGAYSIRTGVSAYIPGLFVGSGSTIYINGISSSGDGKAAFPIGELLENDLVTQLSDKTVISGKAVFFAQATMGVGYPDACAFYQGRLWLGGFREVPNLIVASAIDKYLNFESGTAKDTDPLNFKLSSDVTAKIKHIIATKTMLLLSDVGEFAFLSSSGSGTITGANVNITLQTKNGTTDCKPQELDDQLFYVQAGGNVIRGTDYSYTSNSYQALNVSILSPEVINNPVDSCTIKNLNNDDNSYLIYVNSDGSIACLQSVQSQNIAGWSKWTTHAREFKSVCTVNNRSFCIVYNPSSNITTLEEFSLTTYTDCQVPITLTAGVGSTSVAINNASILLNDGHLFQPNNATPTTAFNVQDSAINGIGICGITIASIMTTSAYSLRNEQIGDLLFTAKKLSDIYVYYYKTIGLNIVVNEIESVIPLLCYDLSLYNTPLVPKTDIFKTDVTIDWSLLTSISFTQAVPYPVTILSIGATLNI